jgi:hypothetical protein
MPILICHHALQMAQQQDKNYGRNSFDFSIVNKA